ncbi:uncharacterized protein LOC132628417 [Lycium barbarum]|uniref:uncharacterized protein LOC132628417 n=1 Tax=Lycium barbarum TaxID=112863 RepID=UPI00293F0BEB|nr:uncharacterized protein LOC132628417 [Lycium barbarum]
MNGIAYSLPPPYSFGRPYMAPRESFTEAPPQSPSMMSTPGYPTPQGFTRYTSGSQQATSSGTPMATPSPTASHHSSSSIEQHNITGPDLPESSTAPHTPTANDLRRGLSASQLESYDSSGRLIIEPAGYGSSPDKALRLLTNEIEKLFKDSPTWGQMSPNRQRQIYFAFKEKCVWCPKHETQLAQNFQKKAQRLLSDMLGKVRESNTKPKWILPENYAKLLHYWATNKRFLQLSDIGKKARNSTKGGSLHTSGAMSQEAELKRGTPVPQDEAFKITHVKKKANTNDPDQWCEERAKQTYAEFLHTQSPNTQLTEEQMEERRLENVGGPTRFGTAYGMPHRAFRQYRSPLEGLHSSNIESFDRVSAMAMEQNIAELSSQLQASEERER